MWLLRIWIRQKPLLKQIELLTAEVEVGKTYTGEVKRIMNFGAFIEVLPGKEGLLHISKMAKRRVEKVEDVMNIGDVIEVIVVRNRQSGKNQSEETESLKTVIDCNKKCF